MLTNWPKLGVGDFSQFIYTVDFIKCFENVCHWQLVTDIQCIWAGFINNKPGLLLIQKVYNSDSNINVYGCLLHICKFILPNAATLKHSEVRQQIKIMLTSLSLKQ